MRTRLGKAKEFDQILDVLHFHQHSNVIARCNNTYEGVSKSFRTGSLERELHMVQLSGTRRSCIAILWVSLVSFAAIILYVASQRVFIVVSVYFVINSVRKLFDSPSYVILTSWRKCLVLSFAVRITFRGREEEHQTASCRLTYWSKSMATVMTPRFDRYRLSSAICITKSPGIFCMPQFYFSR
jgi:hypothetical protein